MLQPLGGRIVRSDASAAIAYLPQHIRDRPLVPGLAWWTSSRSGSGSAAACSGGITPADREDIDRALAAVGLAGFQTRGIDTLSGGQLQRTLFARVLLQDAPLILLDEPFNAIDSPHAWPT